MALSRTRTTRKIFVDSTVLFAAAYSETGRARDLLRQGLSGRLQLSISDDVLEESERNLRIKAPRALSQFIAFRASLLATVVEPPRALIVKAAEVVAVKDAPIVAAAIAAGAHFLATYDRKHLLSRKEMIEARFGLEVATPDEVLTALRREGAEPR